MKEKMISKSNGFKILIITCSLILLIGVLAGCGEKTEDTLGNNEDVMQEVTNEDEEQPTVDVAPSEEPEPSEEPIVEETEQTLKEWADTLDASEIYCAVWYEDTKEGIILEDGQEISLEPGDKFLYVGTELKGVIDRDALISDLDNSTVSYKMFDVSETIYTYEILYISIEDKNGNNYEYTFYITNENSEMAGNEDGEEYSSQSIYDYVETLNDTKVCVLVTDLNSYIREEIYLSDGDSYTIDENELLWLYLPKETVNITTSTSNVSIWIGEGVDGNLAAIDIFTTGSNIEIPITVEFADGTSQEMTIYITKEWQ